MARLELTVNDLRNLESRIRDKSADIAIVGLGYVGLPLALAFAEAGFNVSGVDADKARVNKITRGVSYLLDIESARLKKAVTKGKLKATTSQSVLRRADTIIICVPTPLTKTKEPDLTYIVSATNDIARFLRLGHLVILESTTYPARHVKWCCRFWSQPGSKWDWIISSLSHRSASIRAAANLRLKTHLKSLEAWTPLPPNLPLCSTGMFREGA
jgi:threonine dehydrogenase-like Zn-dependent dehydrogenase